VLVVVTVLFVMATAQAEDYLGPSAVLGSSDGKTLFVAYADAQQIAWLELPGGKVVRRIDVPAEPTGLTLSPDETQLIVTCAAPRSTVLVLDAVSGEVVTTMNAGHTAMSPVVGPEGKRLYVCNRFDNDVSVIDLATGQQTARVGVDREPVAAALMPDGKTLFVANHLPNTRTDVLFPGSISPVVTAIDTQTFETVGIELPVGCNGMRDLCLSPDGKVAYVTHLVASFERIPTQVDMGWANVNALSIIDTQQKKLISTVGLDELYMGTGNPWGVTCTADGKWVCVCHAGSHELSIVDASTLLGTLPHVYVSPVVGSVPEGSSRSAGLWRRVKLPGKGPRGLAVAGSKVYVAQYFSDALAVVDIVAPGATTEDQDEPVGTIALGPEPVLTVRRQGELLFNDASICFQHWQSCASCHPDARSDALNWDLLNDGASNPKNTKSMLLAHRTPPSMAEGVRPTAEAAVRAGIEHILFTSRPEEDAAAIDEYLRSLRPIPSPKLVDGRLSPAAGRGKILFEGDRGGCHRCHPAPLYTDLLTHDVGSKSPYGFTDRFDTPTLIEVWRTAPYLHDGRYVTIGALMTEGKHGLGHTRVKNLSQTDIDDLIEFVLSL